MATLAIIWRNPKCPPRLRRWTHVRHDANRSLYIVLESVSPAENTWEGLPTLEVVRGRSTNTKRNETKFQHLSTGA